MPVATQLWHLSRLDFLAGASEDEICNHLGYETVTTITKLPRRRYLAIEEGSGKVYGLSEGLAKVSRTARSGRRVVEALLRPGDLFGRLGDDSGPRITVHLDAITPCTLVSLKADRLRDFLRGHPDLMLTVVQLLEDRQRRLSRRVESLVFKEVPIRVIETLLQLAVDIPESCPYGLAVDVRVSQSDIAELVGASRQAVNKVMRELERKDLLHRHDGVLCIQDIQQLNRLIASETPPA